ncbi:hypothetical protein [Aeromonas enteropelogenes]|uniref:hypothetical protein n=1 Tax=Aeromonas enteropelogenes TaxID=29489 RepID=UPI003BA0A5C8
MAKYEISEPQITKPIQLKVSNEKHNEIKSYAATQGLSMSALLLIAYEEYRSLHN